MSRARVSARVVIGLNAARALAAFYVVAHHTLVDVVPSPFNLILRFGQEAVILFFLLSGFVIYLNEHDRYRQTGGYVWRRLRRIYPPLVGALVISAVVFGINGWAIDADEFVRIASTLLALQDVSSLKPGVISDPAFGNVPLWSLSYEIAFYILFPIVMRTFEGRQTTATWAIGTFAAAAYVTFLVSPNHFSLVFAYFSIWWSGAMAAKAYLVDGITIRSMAQPIAMLATVAVVATVGALSDTRSIGSFGVHPLLEVRHFWFALLVVVLGTTSIAKLYADVASRSPGLWAWLASISYGVYVLHWPLMVQWSGAHSTGGLVLAFMFTVSIAYLIDRQGQRLLAGVRW
jgi:peptidoglycan/LPS O-acetylase OafA/YrhL